LASNLSLRIGRVPAGTEASVNAPPDGYTLLLIAPPNAINAPLCEKLSFNFIRDIAPVAGIVRAPLVMEVNPSFPAKTVPAFIAHAKANPGKLNMASAGNGTLSHVAGELFKILAFDIYKLVEINTVTATGDTGRAADARPPAGVSAVGQVLPLALQEDRSPPRQPGRQSSTSLKLDLFEGEPTRHCPGPRTSAPSPVLANGHRRERRSACRRILRAGGKPSRS
jgi:hypothetical protein